MNDRIYPVFFARLYAFRKYINLAFLLVMTSGFAMPASGAVAENIPDFEAAIARAEKWIAANPATLDDGGINDIIDEGVSLYVLSNLTLNQQESEQYTAALREHMAQLEGMPAFRQFASEQHRRLIDVYHLLLAAHLARSAGVPFDDEPGIIERARQALMTTPYCGPSVRLTVVILLDYLGAQPVLDMNYLREAGSIAQLARSGNQQPLPGADNPSAFRIAEFNLYAIVHETVVLIDFGRRPVPPWLNAHRDVVREKLNAGVKWALERANYDLLAELLITLRLLDTPESKGLRDAVVALAQAQQPDGTWGESVTTTRANRVRHTVLTGVQALRMNGVGLH